MPETVIEKMSVPHGKVVEVFLLGVGYSFPVQYSLDIRSRLHNGSSACPTLFWAKEKNQLEFEMFHILDQMRKNETSFFVSIPAKVLPHENGQTKTDAYNGEFLYLILSFIFWKIGYHYYYLIHMVQLYSESSYF